MDRLGLESLRAGKSATETLKKLLAADEGRDLRQVAMVDQSGCVATHTGKRCIAEAGHIIGEGFSTQANMMLYDTVWPAMAEAYRALNRSSGGSPVGCAWMLPNRPAGISADSRALPSWLLRENRPEKPGKASGWTCGWRITLHRLMS